MKLALKILLPLIILALGIGLAVMLVKNPDEARRAPNTGPAGFLVKTETSERGDYHVMIEALGEVMPAKDIALKSQVAGEIIAVSENFIPGGVFKKGEVIFTIEPRDYELALTQARAELDQAKADYDLEIGRQKIAQDELKMLARTTGREIENPELALRKPQLAQAKAAIARAQAAFETAKLDLERTEIKAPFDALVLSRSATLGDKITTNDTIAQIVSTKEYWLEVSLPVSNLRWIKTPSPASAKPPFPSPRRGEGDLEQRERSGEGGNSVTIHLDNNRGKRSGKVLRLIGSLDETSRLARLLVSIPDPLALTEDNKDKTAMIAGDFARAVITGEKLENIIRIPLSWIRDGGQVWVNEDGTLVFRDIRITHQDRDYAYISEGLSRRDEVITSDIPVPAEGMALRSMDEARKDVQAKMPDLMGLRE